MGDLLNDGLKWLADKRKAVMSSEITYRRSSIELTLLATIGKPDVDVADDNGLRISASMIDFLITASDFEATFTAPKRGDVIVYDDRIYEVMDFGGQGIWRWSGYPGSTMRIHTKQTG